MSQISSLSYFEVSIRMDGEKVITHNCIDQWVIETACNRSGSQIQKIPTTFAFLLQNTVQKSIFHPILQYYSFTTNCSCQIKINVLYALRQNIIGKKYTSLHL